MQRQHLNQFCLRPAPASAARVDAFAELIASTYPPTRVIDVGSCTALSARLSVLGFRPTLINPNVTKDHRRLQGLQTRRRCFDPIHDRAPLVVAIHPCEATPTVALAAMTANVILHPCCEWSRAAGRTRLLNLWHRLGVSSADVQIRELGSVLMAGSILLGKAPPIEAPPALPDSITYTERITHYLKANYTPEVLIRRLKLSPSELESLRASLRNCRCQICGVYRGELDPLLALYCCSTCECALCRFIRRAFQVFGFRIFGDEPDMQAAVAQLMGLLGISTN